MIRRATKEDIDEIEQIYHEILDEEAANVSYTNWQKGLYPTKKHAEQALLEGTLYVGEDDGTLYGCVNLNHVQPKEYQEINWLTKSEEKEVLVIHTLCIRPSYAGLGKGKEFVHFIENLAKEKGCKTIRLDTYEGNVKAASLYTKLGYTYVGSTKFHFENVIWETLICFEKPID